jgi:hypothetical protein
MEKSYEDRFIEKLEKIEEEEWKEKNGIKL